MAAPRTDAKGQPASVLQVRQLHFGWPGRPVFQGLNADLPPGLSLVTGDDGCGKSTLLRLLAGELLAHAGSLALNGRAVSPADPEWSAEVFWTDPQTRAHDTLSADRYLRQIGHRFPRFSTEAANRLIGVLNLGPHLDEPLHMLSTGSRRKVWLTAAFAAGAAVTLIDQPFAALDGPAIRFLHTLLQEVSMHPDRAWLIADHEAPADVPLASTIRL